ncbi:MAG: helix-turn-helix transcriptional regulator [Bacilli bacterium]|nr:helix-turn-helix transcriptional regulator [Bacilli bacterium]
MNNQFSENLKKIRKENNLSQEQLADELGVSRQAISKWESSVAYPEMDKIIMICNKFNLNIDDLLNKDIKEVKGEEESKKRINNVIDSVLKFITDSINLFSRLSFKSKIKCLFEQAVIMFLLFCVSFLLGHLFSGLFSNIFAIFPYKIEYFLDNIIDQILIILFIFGSIMVMAHVFKIRYLDYYYKLNDEKESVEELKDENGNKRILIRDPKHSEYRFIKGLFKFIVLIIKFFLFTFGLFLSAMIVFLCVSLVLSFLVAKTGLFFIGLLLSIIASILICVVVLVPIYNFIFNRQINKKRVIYSFIVLLVFLGVGIGISTIGALNFKVIDESEYKVVNKEYEMKENLVLYPGLGDEVITYVETSDNTVKVDYKVTKLSEVQDYSDVDDVIRVYVYLNNPVDVVKTIIKNLSNKKIVRIDSELDNITIYSNKDNIKKLKENKENYYKSFEDDYYEE